MLLVVVQLSWSEKQMNTEVFENVNKILIRKAAEVNISVNRMQVLWFILKNLVETKQSPHSNLCLYRSGLGLISSHIVLNIDHKTLRFEIFIFKKHSFLFQIFPLVQNAIFLPFA